MPSTPEASYKRFAAETSALRELIRRIQCSPVVDLTLYNRPAQTVFDLLGSKEDDITYSVGWGLAQSEAFARGLLSEVYGDTQQGELTALRLQESEPGTGRTDIEIETELLHLIVEAKRGWTLPLPEQLSKYASRLDARDDREGRIAVVAECASYYPPSQEPVSRDRWCPRSVRALVSRSSSCRDHRGVRGKLR